MKHIIVITGERGAGKSTLCTCLADLLRSKGLSPGGILSPGGREPDGFRSKITAESVTSGERRILGIRPSEGVSSRMGPFSFSDEVFSWALDILSRDIEEGKNPIFLDEVGPHELRARQGYFPFLSLFRGSLASGVFVVRPGLVDDFLEVIPKPAFRVFEVTAKSRDHLAESIVRMLL